MTFRVPRWAPILFWLWPALASIILILASVGPVSLGGFVPWGPIVGVSLILPLILLGRDSPKTLRIAADGIQIVTFLGRRRRMSWDQVESITAFRTGPRSDEERVIRLHGIDGEHITLTNALRQFDAASLMIQQRTAGILRRPPTRWDSLRYGPPTDSEA